MPDIIVWETECGSCGGDLEDAGCVIVEKESYDIVIICNDCYEKDEDSYGIMYISWG